MSDLEEAVARRAKELNDENSSAQIRAEKSRTEHQEKVAQFRADFDRAGVDARDFLIEKRVGQGPIYRPRRYGESADASLGEPVGFGWPLVDKQIFLSSDGLFLRADGGAGRPSINDEVNSRDFGTGHYEGVSFGDATLRLDGHLHWEDTRGGWRDRGALGDYIIDNLARLTTGL